MEVIYGDTDSIMVYSGTDDLKEAKKMADALKRETNKHYRCMEIDIDGVMQSMLLLKKKKCAPLHTALGHSFRPLATSTAFPLALSSDRPWCHVAGTPP